MMIALWCLVVAAKPLPVAYVVQEERTGWQPIDPEDLEATLGQAALEALSKSALLSLDKTTEQGLRQKPREYVLRITGRMVDEAETHTVFLSLEPSGQAEIGSLRASDTVVLGKLKRAEMLARVEESAKRAAADLASNLKGALDRAGNTTPAAPPPNLDTQPLPWHWVDIAPMPSPSLKADDDLDSKDHHKRMASLRELTSLALHEQAPRQALERCALKHSLVDMRVGCLVALRPLSRKLAPTQRVVIEAFRKDTASDVIKEANEQMLYFSGGARMDAINAWLERAAKAEIWGPFDKLGDLPNLDTVVTRCLIAAGKKQKYQRSKRGCIEMMDSMPQPRRKAILWRFVQEVDPESPYYVEGAGKSEGSTGTDWGWAVDHLVKGSKRFEPGLEDILWRRYERDFSAHAMDTLIDYATPSEKMANRFLEVIQTAGERRAVRALERFCKQDPKLAPMIQEKVAEMLATETYHKGVDKRSLEELMKKAGGDSAPAVKQRSGTGKEL